MLVRHIDQASLVRAAYSRLLDDSVPCKYKRRPQALRVAGLLATLAVAKQQPISLDPGAYRADIANLCHACRLPASETLFARFLKTQLCMEDKPG